MTTHADSRDRLDGLLLHACLVLLAVLFTLSVADWTVWPKSHDGLRYHYLLDHFTDALDHGVIYPRFLANAAGGYGYPTFVYYQPGFFYWAALWRLFVPGATVAVYLALVSLAYCGALGAYRATSHIGDHAAGLVCAFLFLLTPYLHVNLLVRGDLGEWMSILLCPWALHYLQALRAEAQAGAVDARTVAALGASVAGVVYSHPATTLFFVPSVCLLALVLSRGLPAPWRYVGHAAMGIGAGAALSLPYWSPLFPMRCHVAYQAAIDDYFLPHKHFVGWSQLVERQWGFGYSTPNHDDGMSFQLGLPHAALAALGWWRARRLPLVTACGGLLIVSTCCMTSLSAPLWAALPVLRFVQFPWRLLSVIAVWQLMCIAGVFHSGAPSWRKLALGGGLCLAAAAWHANMLLAEPKLIKDADRQVRQHREMWLQQIKTYADRDEFTPITAPEFKKLKPRGGKPLVEVGGGRTVETLPDDSPYRLHCRISAGPAADARINQLYLPGWRVRLDGRPLPREELERQLLADGRMQVALSAGPAVELEASYAGPPGGAWRAAGLIAFALVFLAYVWGIRRPSRPPLAAADQAPAAHRAAI